MPSLPYEPPAPALHRSAEAGFVDPLSQLQPDALLGQWRAEGRKTVKEDPTPGSLPLFEEEKEASLPPEKKILQHLSETLSVAKTLKRFPSLSPKYLQEVLQRCADRAEEDPKLPPPNFDPAESPEFCIHADGGSRGNPGESGAGGGHLRFPGPDSQGIENLSGNSHHNEAEYQAAILALERALELGVKRVALFLDSELVVRQLRGEYRVREPRLKSLHNKARETLNRFSQYSILSIPREENRRADQLANEAIDQKSKRIKEKRGRGEGGRQTKSFFALSPLRLFPYIKGCGGGRGIARRAKRAAGGKSELRRAGWSLTATGGDPRESATEKIPPCGISISTILSIF